MTQCMCSATVMLRYELVLEEPDKVYFSGDDVKGHVSISLNSNITLQGMLYTLACRVVLRLILRFNASND